MEHEVAASQLAFSRKWGRQADMAKQTGGELLRAAAGTGCKTQAVAVAAARTPEAGEWKVEQCQEQCAQVAKAEEEADGANSQVEVYPPESILLSSPLVYCSEDIIATQG